MAGRGHHTGFSLFTTSASGWSDPYEPMWNWLDVCDMDSWRWTQSASCMDIDPEIFFKSDKQLNRKFLTPLCQGCPVQQACLEHALLAGERGWWGGTSESERRQLMAGID